MKLVKSNIFDLPCEALVNPVNTQGAMGAGLALQFKKRFPNMFLDYKQACDSNEVIVGKMHVWKGNPLVINFPTKEDWRNLSKIEWIISGLQDLQKVVEENKIKTIAIPPIGCGLGGLQFDLVLKEIEKINWKETEVFVCFN